LLRVDEEVENEIENFETQQLLTLISYIINQDKIDVIIFEDYNKGLITNRLVNKVVELAKSKNIPTCVDPKKKNFNTYKGVSLFKPNLKELSEGLNETRNLKDIDNMTQPVNNLDDLIHCTIYMVTMSEKGVYMRADAKDHHIAAHIRNIADVSGAGDTVISIAALCVALKCNPEFIAELSNLAGGLVCEETGVVPVNKEQLLQEASSLLLA
jgi:rfaE bifunctional protein kinase chain/domain